MRLQVSDVSRSVAYYERTLGMLVHSRTGGSAALGVRGDDSVLIELVEKAGIRPLSRRGLLGLYHFAILMPDRQSLGRFVGHLREIGEYAGMSDHLVSEAVYLTDPDGLGIEVYSDRPRAGWKVVEGQFEMASNPLDVEDLMSAGGGARWDGMPPGTRIGHVHFHVGDLEEASAFYHAGLGLSKIVWGYPGALFLSAGGYHHHVGVNTWAQGASRATDDDARLLDWELVVPDATVVAAAGASLTSAGFSPEPDGDSLIASDPWGIRVKVRPETVAPV